MDFSHYDRDVIIQNLSLYDDEPDTNSDFFSYPNYSTQITSFLVDKATPTPYVIALNGEWGSGKTSLIKRVYTNLMDKKKDNNLKVVWFDAWAYERLDPVPSLMYTIAQEFGSNAKKFKTRQKKMKLWIFATSNDVERLSGPLRSRFMELHLQEYVYEEFIEIVRRLLKKRYRLDVHLSEKIGDAVWNQMKSKDVRDALKIAKLTKSSTDIDWLVDVQIKYGKKRVIPNR